MKIKKEEIRYILKEANKVKGKIIVLTILNILFACLAILIALCSKGIVDGASLKEQQTIFFYSLILLSIIIMQFVLRILISYIYEITKSKQLKEKRQYLLKEVINKEYQNIKEFHSGQILNRIFTDVEIISEGICSLIPELMNLITRLLLAIIALLILDWKFGTVFIFSGVVLFFVAYLYRKKIKKAHKEVLKNEDRVRSFYQDNITNLLVVKIFNRKENVVNKGEELQNKYVQSRIKRRIISIQANSGFNLIFNLFYLFALIWGAYQISQNDFSLGYGTLIALLELIRQVSIPVSGFSSLIPQLYALGASSERLLELEKLPNEEEKEKESNFINLRIENLSFAYKENLVLDSVSFQVKKNDFVAITGLSGGGKTTLFNLILGVYKNYQGKITINDHLIPDSNTRSIFSYVPQGNTMFSGTIRENLTFLDETINDERIYQALKDACAYDFVMALDDKLDSIIGEKGIGLSEGQCQRLTIARALLFDSPVLLLDEATSALDDKTEVEVLKNISRLDKTIIIVTHRKEALKYCNKNLLLEDGKIRENK